MAAALTYAIGDIHGSYTKLANLVRHCVDHSGENDARFVFVGDYIDRGKRSYDVVKFLIDAQAAWPDKMICLKGNHEDMLLDAVHYRDEMMWLDNGGDATLRSYGVRRATDIPAEHLAWFETLPLSHGDERRFFVHAGIMPGIPLEQQRKDVILWIREPFLSDASDHGRYIVHGHTPTGTGAPELCHNRLNLDTLAWYGNPLIAAVFDERRVGPLCFIADDGAIRAAPAINAREQELFASGMRARAR
ncbi:MAG: serine/threonine protein phosphatase [Rhizobiales bacterium]|nr:serine/threonine protein phosphatase [Hyphomicrobiales bacterium]